MTINGKGEQKPSALLSKNLGPLQVADVVTGKLDVREAAAKLPDETEETGAPELLAEPDEQADSEDRDEPGPDRITAEELDEVADE